MNIMFVETRVFTRRVTQLGLEGALKGHLLFVYAKDEAETLTPGQKRQLKHLVSAIKGSHRDRKEKS